MPRKLKVPCAHPGCPELVDPGRHFCGEHRKLHPEYLRNPNHRGYTSRWRKAAKSYLNSHPLCVICAQKDPPRYTKATVVDHIVPHRGDTELFWDRTNWQALCKQCHDQKTLKEDIHPVYEYRF